MIEGLQKLHLNYSEEQVDLLKRYIGEIEMWNPRYGLVNASGDALITRHILDSLAGLEPIALRRIKTMADVGSGAGLPGIPLAIMMPGTSVTLIERSGKRVRFLRNVTALLNLKNVTVLEKDLKDISSTFDLVTFRAFRPIEPVIMKQLTGILSDSGVLAAYKGKRENVEEEKSLVSDIGRAEEIIPLHVPGLDEERHLVFYSRI